MGQWLIPLALRNGNIDRSPENWGNAPFILLAGFNSHSHAAWTLSQRVRADAGIALASEFLDRGRKGLQDWACLPGRLCSLHAKLTGLKPAE